MKPASLRYLPLFIILNTIGPALAAKAETLPKFRTVAEPIPGEYIVVFDEHPAIQLGITRAPADAIAATYRGKIHFYYDAALQGFSIWISEEAAREISARTDVAWVQEVAVTHAAGSENVATLPNLDRVDQRNTPLDNLYNYPLSGQGVRIYILDTGIRFTHTEFGGRAFGAHDSVNDGHGMDDACTTAGNGHGTHVASVAAGATYGTAKASTLELVPSLRVQWRWYSLAAHRRRELGRSKCSSPSSREH